MIDDIEIIAATPADAPEAIRLFGELHRFNSELDTRFALADGWESLVEEYLRQTQAADDSTWLLARAGNRTIGFVLVEVHTDSPLYRYRRWAEIVGLFVEAAYRGSAAARMLMEHAYDWAIRRNLRVMQLYVTAPNQPARRFYEKQGFEDSQVILRRMLTPDDIQAEAHAAHGRSRLHFSEGGARPLDMHGHDHD